MTLSIRNQIPGTVTSVDRGDVMSVVRVRLDGGQDMTAVVTLEAVRELGLAEGSAVRVLVKATEVSLSTGPLDGVSIRNQLRGAIVGVSTGDAMAVVRISVPDGELTAAVTMEAVNDLGLAPGQEIVALVKATEVSLATA